MNDDLSHIATWAEALLNRLSPAQRRSLLRRIAIDLRRSQAQRIAVQQAPDGTAYTPRKQRRKLKTKQGRIKQQKAAMFSKLRMARHLKIQQDANQLSVGFSGRVARIARVHQEGLNDRMTRGGAKYPYSERQLLGFSSIDIVLIRESFLHYLD